MKAKCKINMSHKVEPVKGSAAGAEGKRTGTCPECSTPGVMLSIVGGFIRAHEVADRPVPQNNPQPPTLVETPVKYGKGLSEPLTGLTDTGVRTGDPRSAEKRRVAEIEGAAGIGTVMVPRKVPGKGTLKSGATRMVTKMTEVPATEDHVREALDYWRKRKITDRTSDDVRKRQAEEVSSLCRRLEGFRQAREDETPNRRPHLSASVDTAQAHRGPTLVRGRDTTPRLRDPELPWDESTDLRKDGTVRKSTTLDQPLGRERFDRKITDVPEPKRRRTNAERRRYRRMVAAAGRTNGK